MQQEPVGQGAMPQQVEQPQAISGPNYKLRSALSGHRMSVSSIKFSPDGSILASAGLSNFAFCPAA